VGVGTARRLLLGRTELKKFAIVPDIVGFREGMMQKQSQKERTWEEADYQERFFGRSFKNSTTRRA